MPKLALAIIAKDEVEQVKSIILKYGQYFDEIAIAADERLEEFNKLKVPSGKVSIYPYVWCNDFSHKRNFLASQIQSEYYLRMDTDDDIGNVEILPRLFQQLVEKQIDVHYAPYDYAKDANGNVVARHWRETIIKKRPDIYWKKTIHENVFMDNQDTCRLSKDKSLIIIHNIDTTHAIQSFKRNFEALLAEYKQDGENTDPRTIAYLGRMMMAEGSWERANFFLEKLVLRSGWDDDKYFAYVQMAQCYMNLGKYPVAIACCNEALAINTKFPDAFLQLGYIYLAKGDYEKAVDWLMPGVVRPEPDTCMVYDPSMYTSQAKMAAAMALLGKGDVEQALVWFNRAKQANPHAPDIQKYESTFQSAYEALEYVRKLTWLVMYARVNDPAKVPLLLDTIPKTLEHDERLWALRNANVQPHVHGDKEVTIYCGPAWEDWSPISVLKGIGGSEEAVIYLSRELARLGYNVTVYNGCGEMKGVYDGVTYLPFYSFNPNDTYNILIEWRRAYLDRVKANKKFVWLHDVPSGNSFTKESIKNFDKIICLSNYHRSLLPKWIPDEKVFVSSNGVNLDDFNISGVLMDKQRMIYTSSYDRGLQHLLTMWPQIKEAVPAAELHIFYGWNTYDEMLKSGVRDPLFKDVMVQLMKQDGIVDHGRVGHKQLAREFAKSNFWVYPSHFEEISCISAMKAQVAGCIPICTDYAALAETVKAGIVVKGSCSDPSVQQQFKEELINGLQDEKRQEEIRQEVVKHRSEFDWDRVAEDWHLQLFIGPPAVCSRVML